MSSHGAEEIFLPRLAKSWRADVFIGPKASTAMGAKKYSLPMLAYFPLCERRRVPLQHLSIIIIIIIIIVAKTQEIHLMLIK